jgi:2',3'-cyclic-nucleotide 2'-phosphodiesterase / 3'-nucleotidase / 5'-nucleotidase
VYYWYVEEAKWELIGGEYNNGEISAYTDHFSTYGVFEGEPESNKIPTQADHELPNTATNNFKILLAGLILVLSGVVVYFVKRGNAISN